MPRAPPPLGHEGRLSLVDHLDELRRRLIICIATLLAAFSFCFAENHAILKIVTKPVTDTQKAQKTNKNSDDPLAQAARYQREQEQALESLAPALSLTGKTIASLRDSDSVTSAQQLQLDR